MLKQALQNKQTVQQVMRDPKAFTELMIEDIEKGRKMLEENQGSDKI